VKEDRNGKMVGKKGSGKQKVIITVGNLEPKRKMMLQTPSRKRP